MKIEAFKKFSVAKRNNYERLPLDDGQYLILGVGQYHGMSITDKDWFNTRPKDKPRTILLIRCNGTLISTAPRSISISELQSIIDDGYVTELS